MGFGGEVYNGVEGFICEQTGEQSAVENVAMDEAVAGVGLDGGDVFEVAGVGEL